MSRWPLVFFMLVVGLQFGATFIPSVQADFEPVPLWCVRLATAVLILAGCVKLRALGTIEKTRRNLEVGITHIFRRPVR